MTWKRDVSQHFGQRRHLMTPMSPFQGSPGEVLKDPRVQCWIENYRNLLDAWRFWHKRAEFDIHRGKLDPTSKPLAQVEPAKWISSCDIEFFETLRLFFLQKSNIIFVVLLRKKNVFIFLVATVAETLSAVYWTEISALRCRPGGSLYFSFSCRSLSYRFNT